MEKFVPTFRVGKSRGKKEKKISTECHKISTFCTCDNCKHAKKFDHLVCRALTDRTSTFHEIIVLHCKEFSK